VSAPHATQDPALEAFRDPLLDTEGEAPRSDRELLQRGLAWLGPEERTRGALFAALLGVVRAWGGDTAAGALLPRRPSGGWSAAQLYPSQEFLRLMAACTDYLTEMLGSRELALQCLGAEVAHAYLAAPGGPLAGAVAARDPGALLERLPAVLDVALGFGRHRTHALGLRHRRLQCSADPLPADFYLGLLQRLLLEVEVDGEVHAHTRGLGDVGYDCTWQPPPTR
jgi:uncharacterized protein (TIGR02265 family)